MTEETNQAWEQQLTERVGAMFAQRNQPLNADLERLEQTVTGLRASLAADGAAQVSEAAALTAHVRQLLQENTRQAEAEYEARLAQELERTRAEISINIRQTLEADFERKLAQTTTAHTASQLQIAQLQTQLTAAAAAVAAPVSPTPDYIAFKAAVEEIDAQRTQSETLTALIKGAAQFAPRVAFFVVKGGDAVGWKAAGFQNGLNDETVRSLSVSTQTPNLLMQALTAQTAAVALNPPAAEIANVLGRYGDLAPRGAVAVPLVVRGKAAAVLYADSAEGVDDAIQLEALETLIHVASMGIELLPVRRNAEPVVRVTAAVQPPTAPEAYAAPVAAEPPPPVAPAFFDSPSMPFGANPAFAEAREESPTPVEAAVSSSPDVTEAVAALPSPAPPQVEPEPQPVATAPLAEPPAFAQAAASIEEAKPENLSIFERLRAGMEAKEAEAPPPPVPVVEAAPLPATPSVPPAPTNALDAPTWMRRLESPAISAPSLPSLEDAPPVRPTPPAPPPMHKPSLANWGAKERETDDDARTAVTAPFKADTPSLKLAEAVPNFNQPSEPPRYAAPSLSVSTAASETEVRAHNDARRFARLLISEIKLYNAAKVNEGRRNGDLYERLHDEIDRSRKVYDKRVSPTVAAKFDYFYDELVQTLAEGDPSKLGEHCPGPFVVTA